jgi:hypothetical protein
MHKIKHCRIAERKAPRLNEEFIKFQITGLVKTRFEEAIILPPTLSIIRKDFKENKK